MSRCITTGRSGLLALLLLLPSLASAQISGQGIQAANQGVFLGHAGTVNCGANLVCTLNAGIETISGTGVPAGTVTGSGTTGVLPVWTNGPASVLGDSHVSQSGTVVTVTGSLGVTTANTHTGVLYVDGSGHVAAGGDGSGALQFSYVPGAGAANGSIDFSVAKAITTPDDGDVEQTGAFITAYIDHLDSANHPNTYGAAVFEGDHIGTGLVANMKGSTSTASTKNGNVTALYGSLHQTLAVGSGNITGASSAVALMPANSGSGTITTASGLLVENGSLINPSTGIITNMYGVKINAQTGPTVTNQYGLWIGDVALGGTIARAIQTGSGDVLLGTLAGSGTRMVTASSTGVLGTQAITTGTVTSIATTSPIAGGTITTTGTISCPTCITSAVTSATGTANQITVSASTGAVTWSLPSAVTMPGSLTVTTRTGTPATMAVFTSGGVLAETTLPSSGTVTSIATTSPITGGTITTTGTIACATCVTSAASLTANAIVLGAGSQATSALGSLGTTTTVLHGNAAGAPTFGAVVLTTDVSGVLPVANGGAATAITWTNCFMGATRCDVANTTEIINSLTTRKVWLFELPYAMTVNQFSTIFGSAVTPGTMKMCVYTADGATKSIDITVTPATGVVSGSVSAVAITPGLYWFVVGCATTCNVQLNSGFAMTVLLTTSTPSGKTPWVGTVSHTSGTCNTTLGTVTAAANTTPVFRLDN